MQGTCTTMCPDHELQMREKERLLHLLEMVPGTERNKYPKADRNRTVKAFSRSAAGRQTHAEDLRPANVLLKTVAHLLFDVADTAHLPWNIVYDFITDRLMAVRQDMVIQDLSKLESIAILQPIVRFHAYSAYRLCNQAVHKFDTTLNNKHLQECLKKLLGLYDFIGCDYDEYSAKNRLEFEAMYLVFNLGHAEALNRFLHLPKEYRQDAVLIAFFMSLAYQNGNYVRVCRLMKTLPPLLAAVASLHLAGLRRKALGIMSVAYNSKNITFPTEVLKRLLLYGSVDDLLHDCSEYGVYFHENSAVSFAKDAFRTSAKTSSSGYEVFVEEMFLGKSLQSLIFPND